MKGLANLSPMQIASLSLSGSFMASIVYLLPIRTDSSLRALWIAVGISLFAAGIILAFKLPTELESGIANQRWPESQVEKLRTVLNAPAVTVLQVVFLIAYASMVFLHNNARHIAWCFYLPVMATTQLRKASKEPKPKGPFERLDWRSIPPLQSEHWGEK